MDCDLPYRAELDEIVSKEGFAVEGHDTVFTGTCADCRRAAEERL